jgi:hypothetical protein
LELVGESRTPGALAAAASGRGVATLHRSHERGDCGVKEVVVVVVVVVVMMMIRLYW